MDFMNGSIITFHMIPCCCTSETNPDYTVKTYIEGLCPDCWIPMSKIGSNIHVHCPGCVTPGAQTTSAYLIRDGSSLGYPDGNNDGIKDSNQQINLSTYSEASNVRLNRSILGDLLVSVVNGNFFGGSAGCNNSTGGMDYATLQSRICNAASCSSNVATPYTFTHLYLDQTIPFSEAAKFNLQLQTFDFTVVRLGADSDTVTYSFPTSRIDDINNNHHIGAQFLFDITPTDIQSGNGPFASGYAFTPGELYSARITYRVCSNFKPAGASEIPVDNRSRSEILNVFFFSVVSLPQVPFQEHTQFGDHYIDEQPSSQNYNCNGLCHTDIFQCATFTSLHYFYTIHTENYLSFFNNYPLSSSLFNACGKYIYAQALGTIGGGDDPNNYYSSTNIFPYEFRPSPVLNKFHITIPAGYKVKPNTARLGNIFATRGTCYPFAVNVSRKNITVPLTGNFDVILSAVDAAPGMGLNAPNTCGYDNYESGSIMKGDENTYYSLFMELEVADCPSTPAEVTINPNDIQMEFEGHDCSSSSPFTDHMVCNPCTPMQKPARCCSLMISAIRYAFPPILLFVP
jgi:hypothetical protein